MKKIFTLIVSLIFINTLNAQGSQYDYSDTLVKTKIGDTSYLFKYIPVNIENGHGDSTLVSFSANIPILIWQSFVSKNDNNEKKSFFKIARILSLKAQYSLINKMSFEPLKKQFFFIRDNEFVSVYEMMGRNGLGNSIETKSIVKYNPYE